MTKAQWRNKFHRDDDWKKSEQALIKKHWKTKSDREISNLPLLKGVRILPNHKALTESIVMRSKTETIRRIEATHNLLKKPDTRRPEGM